MSKHFGIITLITGTLLFSACTSASNNTSANTTSDDTISVVTEKEGDVRLQNGSLQYLRADGTWATLVTTEELEKAVKASNTAAPSASPATATPNTNTVTVRGAKGDKGDTGAAGATGASGASGKDGRDGRDGKDGKDGTQVTIDSEGQLVLDGVGTGYYLTKKDDSDKKKIDVPTNLAIDDRNHDSSWGLKWKYDYNAAYYEITINDHSFFSTGGTNTYWFSSEEFGPGDYTITVTAHPYSDNLAPNSTTKTFHVMRSLRIPYGWIRQDYHFETDTTTYTLKWDEVKNAADYTVKIDDFSEVTVKECQFAIPSNIPKGNQKITITANPADNNLYYPAVYETTFDNTPVPVITPEPTPPPTPEPTPTPGPTEVSTTDTTPEPEPAQICWDGSVIPATQSCPAQTTADPTTESTAEPSANP